MFEDDEDLTNSDDYTEILSSEIDSIEDDMDEEEDDSITDEETADDLIDDNITYISDDMLDKMLTRYFYESDRPVWKFKYDGDVFNGKVIQKINDDKYVFAIMPSNDLKMINLSKLNR